MIVFADLNNHFFDVSGALVPRSEALLQRSVLAQITDGDLVSGSTLFDSGLEKADREQQYLVARGRGFVALEAATAPTVRLAALRRRATENLKVRGESAYRGFQARRAFEVSTALFGQPASLRDVLDAFQRILLLDAFTLWVSNPVTRHFSALESSCTLSVTHLPDGVEEELAAFVRGEPAIEQTPVTLSPLVPSGMSSRCRVKLDLGMGDDLDTTVGVLEFFAARRDVRLDPVELTLVRRYIETKYLEYARESALSLARMERLWVANYDGAVDKFLKDVVVSVRNELRFEACSIFLSDPASGSLVLKATADAKLDGTPDRAFAYRKSDQALTAGVWATGQLAFSYDIGKEPGNSNLYNEETAGPPRNWIAMALRYPGGSGGVLRVKNKVRRDRSPADLSTWDFFNLKQVVANVQSMLRIDAVMREHDARRSEATAFKRVFLHEIRNPINNFTVTPLRLLREIRALNLGDRTSGIERRIGDIYTMGTRLKFVSETFRVEELLSRENPRQLSVLGDIVLPVVNISRDFIKQEYHVDVEVEDTDLKGVKVYGDQNLLNLAFNILIDNAGKYSHGTKAIRVCGTSDGQFAHIVVRNFGLGIDEGEQELIFEEGKRGRSAKANRIEGTGIGLHLAREVANRQRGRLTLSRLSNPVEFTLSIPLSAGKG